MKKMTILPVLCLLLLFFTACGQEEADPSVTEIAERLAADVTFSDGLTELSAGDAMTLYALSDAEAAEATAYVSSGATAEEISVWRGRDDDGVRAIQEKIAERMTLQTEGYRAYQPAEVPRLEKYILKTNGDFVVLCVTDDQTTANELLTELGF